MKRSKKLQLSLLGITPLALIGCGGPKEDVLVYRDDNQCSMDSQLSKEICVSDYKTAVNIHQTTAPKYKYYADCFDDFGSTCQWQTNEEYIPTMEGYMLATQEARNSGMAFTVVPLYLSDDGDYVTGDYEDVGGNGYSSYGRRKVPKYRTTEPSTKTRTMSRGGFGSKSSSRSSWGG
ncbi:hypothetical protein EOPP23_17935 [Endozoicomonas sp. OPT23]|uniref:DUF1190 domain-containing protein n=1 Tax=Endozoicomonas sp. OPT23 TaxID=2072845 RepID=UPI00129B3450|nr:DUF1190 domain-containing protein [Endozoicomonas sp. OPT23]MRI34861.1 hypothetical protein [Endozoicomonas sp. OPT23]